MSKFISSCGGGSARTSVMTSTIPNNLCLFSDIEKLFDVDDDDNNGEFDIIIDDSDDENNININNSLKTTELINDFYYFNTSSEGKKYKLKIKSTTKVWKLNDHIKEKMDYLYKTSRNFGKIGGASSNIYHLDSNDISYFLNYYYMLSVLDTLNNDNNQLSEYTCSVINSLYEFVKANNEAFNLNKKIKLFLNFFTRV
jgi:hypothetical protein